MTFKINDFVTVDFDIYANEKLVQTTNESLGKTAGLKINSYGPQTIVIGKGMILPAIDSALMKNISGTIELSSVDAYGSKKIELVKKFPLSAFDEQKLNPVIGMTYDFNGMFGAVKAISGGRVTVDFNNPLAGKKIRVVYSNAKLISEIEDKVYFVLTNGLKVAPSSFAISVSGKIVTLKAADNLVLVADKLSAAFLEMILDFKNYTLIVEAFNSIKDKK